MSMSISDYFQQANEVKMEAELEESLEHSRDLARVNLTVRPLEHQALILKKLAEEYHSTVSTMGAELLWIAISDFLKESGKNVENVALNALNECKKKEK